MITDYNQQSEMIQPPLFDDEPRFWEYHRANPQVYELFKRFTFEKINRGAQHLGASAVAERIRWETSLNTEGDEFKINNNYRAYYARLFMRDFPEHEGFFRVRRSAADEIL